MYNIYQLDYNDRKNLLKKDIFYGQNHEENLKTDGIKI